MWGQAVDTSNTTMCFCTGACREPGGRCTAHYTPNPWPTNPYPTAPWDAPLPLPEDVPIKRVGWTCPVCGRGNAPGTQTCPCIPIPMEITYL